MGCINEKPISVLNLSEPPKQSLAVSQRALELRNNPEAQNTLGNLLAQCFDGLQLYGKTPEQLENTVALFMLVLGDFEERDILNAFRVYVTRSSAMPTPADIVAIITRGGKPAFNQSVYIRLEKKGFDARSSEEDEYMREYEEYQMNGSISS